MSGINAWAEGVVRHSADIVDWTVKELVSMDRKTRKILPINGCLHAGSKIARLYQFSAKLKDDQTYQLQRIEKGRVTWDIENLVHVVVFVLVTSILKWLRAFYRTSISKTMFNFKTNGRVQWDRFSQLTTVLHHLKERKWAKNIFIHKFTNSLGYIAFEFI